MYFLMLMFLSRTFIYFPSLDDILMAFVSRIYLLHILLFSFSHDQSPPDWTEILTYFRGSELQNYFTKILEDNLKPVIKPQYVDQIPKVVTGNVKSLLDRKDDQHNQQRVLDLLGNGVRLTLYCSPDRFKCGHRS